MSIVVMRVEVRCTARLILQFTETAASPFHGPASSLVSSRRDISVTSPRRFDIMSMIFFSLVPEDRRRISSLSLNGAFSSHVPPRNSKASIYFSSLLFVIEISIRRLSHFWIWIWSRQGEIKFTRGTARRAFTHPLRRMDGCLGRIKSCNRKGAALS